MSSCSSSAAGKEFTEHERIAREIEIDFTFAHAYAARRRGANENMNGLVRHKPKNHEFGVDRFH